MFQPQVPAQLPVFQQESFQREPIQQEPIQLEPIQLEPIQLEPIQQESQLRELQLRLVEESHQQALRQLQIHPAAQHLNQELKYQLKLNHPQS